jgi:hypothetical protein
MPTQLVQPWKKWYQPNEEYEKPTHFVVPIMAAGNVLLTKLPKGHSDLSQPKPKPQPKPEEFKNEK